MIGCSLDHSQWIRVRVIQRYFSKQRNLNKTHHYTIKRIDQTMKSALFLFVTLVAPASAIELTPDNWDAETSGKTAFIKFFAPWCGHCKKMKPDWDKLMEAYAGSATELVAEGKLLQRNLSYSLAAAMGQTHSLIRTICRHLQSTALPQASPSATKPASADTLRLNT